MFVKKITFKKVLTDEHFSVIIIIERNTCCYFRGSYKALTPLLDMPSQQGERSGYNRNNLLILLTSQ
jgi:hypothetical protein